MRRLIFAAVAPLVVGACASASPAPASPSYLTSGAFRRAEMEASLVNPSNGYSQLRLAHYAVEGALGWDALPVHNPRTVPIALRELDTPGGVKLDAPLGPDARALAISTEAAAGSAVALRALGEAAFFRYPVQPIPAAQTALDSRGSAQEFGFWLDGDRGVAGLVRAERGDGSAGYAMTCATCHVGTRSGVLTIGVGNDKLDLGRLLVDSAGPTPFGDVSARLAWGPGRVDVTTAAGTEPVRIPDLRAVRFLSHLHHDGTLEQRSLATLAIRLETLIITSNAQALRPPREIALGLATYLWSLGEKLPAPAPQDDAERRGMAIFEAKCASCHQPPVFTGAPVLLETIGTDPSLGRSPERTTGKYRVPSLRGVGTRGPLLHDGSLASLDALFDPARTKPNFPGVLHGASPVAGHVYGLDLDAAARVDLLVYVRAR